ncbi:T9SS type A sorting domain-containing protein [Mangrovivirga sp. M17]|uniref:T9SS type A sorting domain-containing protein n=1 Tax=Mangrovivirga halotolerans TaxID=2993936 RepID=A0ABT3RNY3_9BACT|nr:T9SS type A sorting domain-containing protein [Mangrovivirga halotolerans]MCX2742870.1 T9SS type A sorting domain-containing protein [Mangrovivirga halotolerans]
MIRNIYVGMKQIFIFIAFLLISYQIKSQTCVTIADGSWTDPSTWSCDVGFTPPPDNSIVNIIIGHSVLIPNGEVLDFDPSSLEEVSITSTGVITFDNNSQLVMPSGSEIFVEDGGEITTTPGNSAKTLIQIGGNGIWGRDKSCDGCTDDPLMGPIVLDQYSTPGQLPVELIYFDGENINGQVELNWSTASEENFNFFTVERSLDGVEFIPLGDMLGIGGDQINNYSYTDDFDVDQTTYYRLKATDFDGFIEYHPTIAVYPSGKSTNEEVSVYPNPIRKTNNELVIDLKNSDFSSNSSIVIFNTSGQIVFEKTLHSKVTVINDLALESGIYVARIQHPKGQYTTKLAVE